MTIGKIKDACLTCITLVANHIWLARAIAIDYSTFHICWTIRITCTLWKRIKCWLLKGKWIINLDKPSWQDGKLKKLGWHASHLSPITFGKHSSHFIPAYPSLQEQTPLLPHSKANEPSGLHLQSVKEE